MADNSVFNIHAGIITYIVVERLFDSQRVAHFHNTLRRNEIWDSCNDVAEAVVFLAEAEYVTGQILAADGGMTV